LPAPGFADAAMPTALCDQLRLNDLGPHALRSAAPG
jgi:hypothetical protein